VGLFEADFKMLLDQNFIYSWPSANDRIEAVFRLAGLNVICAEKELENDRWRIVFIRSEPFYFHPDTETAGRISVILQRSQIPIDPESVTLKTASFRMEAVFTWAGGEPGRGVSYNVARRGRLVEIREEYRIN
jgi:hypothetical protein